eukprot:5227157-Prymnesium_polylepis.2
MATNEQAFWRTCRGVGQKLTSTPNVMRTNTYANSMRVPSIPLSLSTRWPPRRRPSTVLSNAT